MAILALMFAMRLNTKRYGLVSKKAHNNKRNDYHTVCSIVFLAGASAVGSCLELRAGAACCGLNHVSLRMPARTDPAMGPIQYTCDISHV